MTVQDTSRKAYHTANLPLRQKQVYNAFVERGPLTDIEIHQHTNLPINVVTGARNGLIHVGLIANSGERKMGPYNKTNIVWKLVKQDAALAETDPREKAPDTSQFSLL